MIDIKTKIGQSFAHLGLTRPEQVYQLFSELRSSFDSAAYAAASDTSAQKLDAIAANWIKAPVGILPQGIGNWVHNNITPLAPYARRAYDHLRTHVEIGLKALRNLDQLGVTFPEQVESLFAQVRQTFDQDVELDQDDLDVEITRVNWL